MANTIDVNGVTALAANSSRYSGRPARGPPRALSASGEGASGGRRRDAPSNGGSVRVGTLYHVVQ